jgi:hypothetical protein
LIPSEKWIWYAKDVFLPAAGSILVGNTAASMRSADYQSRLHWLLFLVFTGLIAFVVSTFIGVQSRRVSWGSPGVLRLKHHP